MSDEELRLLLGISAKTLTNHRTAGNLPPKGTSKEDVLKYLFTNSSAQSAKDRKTEAEIKKLNINNEKLLGNLVPKVEVEEHLKKFYQKIQSTARNLSTQLLNDIVAEDKHRETNKKVIENQLRRFLMSLQREDEE